MTTRIEWCDETWNPMTGCTPCSPACDHCYAERMIGRGMHGYDFTPRFHADRLDKPLHWRKPRRIFVCSMSDLFHEAFTDEQIAEVFARMRFCWWHTFMVLTKRPARAQSLISTYLRDFTYQRVHETMPTWPLPNVWLGVTAENQQTADERIPILLDTPAAVRFVSVEPMLGPVEHCAGVPDRLLDADGGWPWLWLDLDLVILGGETGPGARPMHPEWALDVYRQCKAAGTPFFFKQAGTHWGREVGNAWAHPCPEMLTTREFPAVQS